METVLRTIAVYLILLVLIRLTGRRTLAQFTAFDFLVLLTMDIVFSLLGRDSLLFSKLVNGVPMILVEEGRLLRARLRKARLTEDQVLAAARRTQGIYRLEDIKYAILEASGEISVIPMRA